MPEKFDFSKLDLTKEPDRKKFDEEFLTLSNEEKDKVVLDAHKKAYDINSSETKDCKEAEDIVRIEKEQEEIKKEIVLTPEQENIMKQLIDIAHRTVYIQDIINFKEKINLSQEVIWRIATKAFNESIISGALQVAILIKDVFDLNLSEDFFKLSKNKLGAQEVLIKFLNYNNLGEFLISIQKLNIPKDIVRFVLKKCFIESLSYGRNDSELKKIVNKYFESDFFQSPEVLSAVEQGILHGNFSLSMIDQFDLSDEFLESPEVDLAIKNRVVDEVINNLSNHSLSEESIYTVINFEERFPSFEKNIDQAIIQSFINRLCKRGIEDAIYIKEKFNLSEEIIQQAAKQAIINFINEVSRGDIEYHDYDYIIEIKEKFNLSEEIIQQAMKQGFINCLSLKFVDSAIEIKEEFNLSISPIEIIEKIPEIAILLEKIKEISPDFYNQALKSVDMVIELCNFKDNQDQLFNTIKENPFLLDAVLENPRFGSKLLIKYPEFDDPSKKNVNFLFEAKKEIIQNNPDLDPEALEFRQAMQEKLKGYENNPEILKSLEESGVNTDQWLNYEETQYFNLESGSEIAFSETISTPINRIKETIGAYSYRIKEVLKEYKPELVEYRIQVENISEIEEKIAQMQIELEKAKQAGDEKRVQGMERGMNGLKEKIKNPKTTALWDKLLGDVANFEKLKDTCFNAHEKLIKSENKLQEALSGKMPSGKMIQDLKRELDKNKEELRNGFKSLEKRIEDFKTNLPELISPALGKDRSDALIQEIEQGLMEQFDHYNSDRSTVTNLFSERSDAEKEKLQSRPMSIFVWARNPDIDLYQGNYSDCCIKINSDHMGAESTIADYNTDLGVQIINIWDETKNEPVTAAWCWIGKSNDGDPVLIVDNIESNTLYSTNFSEQLTKELFEYVQYYAKAIGIKKIVLGKANNDLPTSGELAKMDDDENKYEKLGGYNREGGYFLEAEDAHVKVLWEDKKQVKEKIEDRKKEKIIRIEFKDPQIRDLTEADFDRIKQLERKIYSDTDLTLGQTMIDDIEQNNGLAYSIVMSGEQLDNKSREDIGYIIAVDDETDEGDKSVYLEDIAVIPEAQGQGIGWEMMKSFIIKLKDKAQQENKRILLDMHLRENSQRFMEKHNNELEAIGVKLIEESLVPNYYDEGEDALYKVYEIEANKE